MNEKYTINRGGTDTYVSKNKEFDITSIDENIYTDNFYELMKQKKSTCRRAVEYVYDLLRPISVVDIGCGSGEWLALFKEYGVKEVHGYDGEYVKKNLLVIAEDEFTAHDLRNKIIVKKRYDLAISLEVAEHLKEQYADQFVSNLTELSDVVLFSGAIPGQGGDGHINEQWQSYWKEKFELNEFICCDCVHNYLWNLEELNYYYKQNIMLYVKKSNQELIRRLYSIEKDCMLDVVHPIAYLKYKTNLDLLTLLVNDIEGDFLQKYFSENGIKTIAIYGTGRVGQCFYKICKNTDVRVLFCIDARGDYMIGNLPTRSYKDIDEYEVDCIVIASGYHYKEMQENVGYLKTVKIISLIKLLNESQCQGEKVKINGI